MASQVGVELFSREKSIQVLKELIKKAMDEFEEKYNNPPKSNEKLENFEWIRTLGAGAFGRVMLIKHLKTGVYYAMKILTKKQVSSSLVEKSVYSNYFFPTDFREETSYSLLEREKNFTITKLSIRGQVPFQF